jgi:hypothetical protein
VNPAALGDELTLRADRPEVVADRKRRIELAGVIIDAVGLLDAIDAKFGVERVGEPECILDIGFAVARLDGGGRQQGGCQYRPASTTEQLLLEIMAYPTRLPIDDMAGFPMAQSKAALSLV